MNDFYDEAHEYRERIRAEQIAKGDAKYLERFNPDSWTDEELADHAMQENVDQAHYIAGLRHRNQVLRERLALLIEAADTHLTYGSQVSFQRLDRITRNLKDRMVEEPK